MTEEEIRARLTEVATAAGPGVRASLVIGTDKALLAVCYLTGWVGTGPGFAGFGDTASDAISDAECKFAAARAFKGAAA